MLTFPKEWKKIGTKNGIDQPIIVRNGGNLQGNEQHPFLALFDGRAEPAIYLQGVVAAAFGQVRHAMNMLFPKYYSLKEGNITLRLTETMEEGLHVDVFNKGQPLTAAQKNTHRIKIFINIDKEPRQWRTSYDIKNVLRVCRDRLPNALPDDLNVISDIIDRHGVLKDLPKHSLAYPAMSAVIANGETVTHEVVYGRRLIAAEFFCVYSDMLDPSKHSHHCLKNWLTEAGYQIAPDAAAEQARYAHLKGSYELLQSARDATSDRQAAIS